jgi:hypothetical protein
MEKTMKNKGGAPLTDSTQSGTPTTGISTHDVINVAGNQDGSDIVAVPEVPLPVSKPEGRHLINYDEILLPPDGLLPIGHIPTKIPVGKPDIEVYFRTRTDPGWEGNLPIYIHHGASGGDETYLVMPAAQKYLDEQNLLRRVRMFTLINQSGDLILMPIPLPKSDGTTNSYNDGKLRAVTEGRTRWIRMVANTRTKGYDIYYPESKLPEPVWPAHPATFHDALDIAFAGKIIESMDHKLILALRGII